jgi:hypothetical protein
MDELAGFRGADGPGKAVRRWNGSKHFSDKRKVLRASLIRQKPPSSRTATERPRPSLFGQNPAYHLWLPTTVIKRQEGDGHQGQIYDLIRRGGGCPGIATSFFAWTVHARPCRRRRPINIPRQPSAAGERDMVARMY